MVTYYPAIRLSLRSRNRFALVSAVRQVLRRAGTSQDEIARFSREALTTQDPQHFEELCAEWAQREGSDGDR